MTHLNDEQWVEYLYREGTELERLRKHVAGCPDCTAQAEAMAEELGSLQLRAGSPNEVPHTENPFGRAVGPSLQPRKTVPEDALAAAGRVGFSAWIGRRGSGAGSHHRSRLQLWGDGGSRGMRINLSGSECRRPSKQAGSA